MRETPGAAIAAEIRSQPEAWERLLALLERRLRDIVPFFHGAQAVVFGGCGSGLNAAFFAARFFQDRTGMLSLAAPAADLTLFPESVLPRKGNARVVLLSRSGHTTEVVEALDHLKARGVPVLGITCTPDSPLAEGADECLILEPVIEKAVTTTRSFTGMVLALQALSGEVAGPKEVYDQLGRLPGILRERMEAIESQADAWGRGQAWERVAFVANGFAYGLARECQLKVKETCRLESDAYPLMDFRHGPQATVESTSLIVILSMARGREKEVRFAQDMHRLGAKIWAIGADTARDFDVADAVIDYPASVEDAWVGPLYLPPVQWLATVRSLALGLDPDRPANLSYWIQTDR